MLQTVTTLEQARYSGQFGSPLGIASRPSRASECAWGRVPLFDLSHRISRLAQTAYPCKWAQYLCWLKINHYVLSTFPLRRVHPRVSWVFHAFVMAHSQDWIPINTCNHWDCIFGNYITASSEKHNHQQTAPNDKCQQHPHQDRFSNTVGVFQLITSARTTYSQKSTKRCTTVQRGIKARLATVVRLSRRLVFSTAQSIRLSVLSMDGVT